MIHHLFELLDKPYHLDTEATRAAYRSGVVRGLVFGICFLFAGMVIGKLLMWLIYN